MDHDDIAARIEHFIRTEAGVEQDDPDFGRRLDLLDSGYLDSLGFLHLVAFIADEYAVRLSDDALMDPGFATVDGIAAAIRKQRDPR